MLKTLLSSAALNYCTRNSTKYEHNTLSVWSRGYLRNSLNIQMKEIVASVENIPWGYFVSGSKMILQHTEERGWNGGGGGVVLALQNEFNEIFLKVFAEGMSFILTFLQMSNFHKKRSGRTKRNYINNNKTKEKSNHFWFAFTSGDQLGSLCFTIVSWTKRYTTKMCRKCWEKDLLTFDHISCNKKVSSYSFWYAAFGVTHGWS